MHIALLVLLLTSTAWGWTTRGDTTHVGPPGTGIVCVAVSTRAGPGSPGTWNQYAHHAPCYYEDYGTPCDQLPPYHAGKQAPDLTLVPAVDQLQIMTTCPAWSGRPVRCRLREIALYGSGDTRFLWNGLAAQQWCDYTGSYP